MLQNWGHNTKLAVLDLFYMCWTKSIWPWGTSKIIFIKKASKSAHDIASSFRPISIRSHIGKLFERMIERRLRTFLEEESIIEEEQEGFQRGKYTLRFLYRLGLECEWARTHEESSALLNVDIEKAFDSVWLDGLIYKLKNLKINGKKIKMIDVFLRFRKGQIHLDPYTSPLCGIHIGLPQGSVLSLVLFIIFISNFLSNSLKCFEFADDSSVLLSGQKITKSLKDTCSDIEMLCRRWIMAANGSKTEIVPLTTSHEDFTQIKLNGENCKISETTKSLGLNIDSKLNYKEHTEISVAKATRNWHILRRFAIRLARRERSNDEPRPIRFKYHQMTASPKQKGSNWIWLKRGKWSQMLSSQR